jgi:hypothetical protein
VYTYLRRRRGSRKNLEMGKEDGTERRVRGWGRSRNMPMADYGMEGRVGNKRVHRLTKNKRRGQKMGLRVGKKRVHSLEACTQFRNVYTD